VDPTTQIKKKKSKEIDVGIYKYNFLAFKKAKKDSIAKTPHMPRYLELMNTEKIRKIFNALPEMNFSHRQGYHKISCEA
jgi:hypothetical protein